MKNENIAVATSSSTARHAIAFDGYPDNGHRTVSTTKLRVCTRLLFGTVPEIVCILAYRSAYHYTFFDFTMIAYLSLRRPSTSGYFSAQTCTRARAKNIVLSFRILYSTHPFMDLHFIDIRFWTIRWPLWLRGTTVLISYYNLHSISMFRFFCRFIVGRNFFIWRPSVFSPHKSLSLLFIDIILNHW